MWGGGGGVHRVFLPGIGLFSAVINRKWGNLSRRRLPENTHRYKITYIHTVPLANTKKLVHLSWNFYFYCCGILP